MILVASLVMMSGTGCVSVVNDYCLVSSPIKYTDADIEVISDTLAKDILIKDTTYNTLCNE